MDTITSNHGQSRAAFRKGKVPDKVTKFRKKNSYCCNHKILQNLTIFYTLCRLQDIREKNLPVLLEEETQKAVIRKIQRGLRFASGYFPYETKRYEPRNEFTVEEKVLAMVFYTRIHHNYKMLQQFLDLPSKLELLKIFAKLPFRNGEYAGIISSFSIRMRLFCPEERLCKLMFTEIPIKKTEHSGSVLVFMVQSIQAGWYIPLLYQFNKDHVNPEELRTYILDFVARLRYLGIFIVCTTCNPRDHYIRTFELLKAGNSLGPDKAYFKLGRQKIGIIYDVPSLLQLTRDSLVKNTLIYGHNRVKYSYIQEAYELGAKKNMNISKVRKYFFDIESTYAGRLTSVAAQTFSHSMSIQITNMVNASLLPWEALQTAAFVNTVNNLFDSFNGNDVNNDEKPELCCPVHDSSIHWKLWAELLQQINNWRFYDEQANFFTTPNHKQCWRNNIRAMEVIWKICKSRGFTMFETQFLSLHPLDNFLSKLRYYGEGKKDLLSEGQFARAFAACVLNDCLGPLSKHDDEYDYGYQLTNMRCFL